MTRSEPPSALRRQTVVMYRALGTATAITLLVCAGCASAGSPSSPSASTSGTGQVGTSTSSGTAPTTPTTPPDDPLDPVHCAGAVASSALCPRPPGPVSTYTEQSSGQTVRIPVGATVVISLPGGSGGGYLPPVSSSPILHRVSVSGGYPSSQRAYARFRARAPGSADLMSQTDFTCLHSTPACLPAQRSWTLHVVVIDLN
jgi:hypothetical protein